MKTAWQDFLLGATAALGLGVAAVLGASINAGCDAESDSVQASATGSGTAGSGAGAGAGGQGGTSTTGGAGGGTAGGGGSMSFPWTAYPSPSTVDPAWLTTAPSCGAPTDWLEKYFRYRIRLRGNATAEFPGFVSVGPDAGESLPASQRDPTVDCDNSYWTSGCFHPGVPSADGSLDFGDTTIWLGYYLGVLGTEYAVLSDLGLDPAQTAEDLYYALQAFNRLDVSADAWYAGGDAQPDGFFERADVPASFPYQDDGTSLRFPRDDNGLAGYGCMESRQACHPGEVPGIDSGHFESQDQVIGMLYGLALVNHFVPDGVVVQTKDLRAEAQHITDRMVRKLRAGKPGDVLGETKWIVWDPDGARPSNAWGGDARAFSDPIARCANEICTSAFCLADYRNTVSNAVGVVGWQGLVTSWAAQSGINRSMALKMAMITGEWDADTFLARSFDYGAPMFAFAHALLHGLDVGPIDLWEIETILSSAPCNGPCHNTAGCEEVPNWRGDDRWKDPENRNGNGNRNLGQYSGMDYMVMHNLYYLVRNGQYGWRTPEPPSSGCEAFVGIDALVSGTAATSYDPSDPCALGDMQRVYCGRNFAAWLEAAYRGEVELQVGGRQFACTGATPCTLSPAQSPTNAALIIGTSGPDSIQGSDHSDCIYGMAGDDVIQARLGRDEVHGGDGNDSIYGETSGVDASGDDDLLFGEAGDDYLHGGPGQDTLVGGDGQDTLWGGLGDDALDGNAGDDDLHGDTTDDVSGGGDDIITGGAGNDTLDGQSGDDYLEGNEGNDLIWGGAGNDRLLGGSGCDRMDGEDGNDSFVGSAGDDFMRGGAGNDTLWAGDDDDRLCGDDGDDTLTGEFGSNQCCPGTGTDTLDWGCNGAPSCPSGDPCGDAAFVAWAPAHCD
jgi:hypothetical protein